MKSTIGRPRKLTDQQVKVILAWHARYLLWKVLGKRLKSQREIARHMGVSQATISYAIRISGRYKTAPPIARGQERPGL